MIKSTDIRTLKNINAPARYTIPAVRGLHLWVRSDLKKYWVFRYTFEKERYDISLGAFPEVSLSDAKSKVAQARGKLFNGVNPADERRSQKQVAVETKPSMSFEKYALQYVQVMSPAWTNPKHTFQWERTLINYAFPVIGHLHLEAIKTSHILEILQPIWGEINETADRLRGRIEKILSAAITNGYRESSNPAVWKGHLENLLPRVKRTKKHHNALAFKDISTFMAKLRNVSGLASLALQFTILNASRTNEVLSAKSSEVEESVWTIPAHRMKARREHQVPLCKRSLEIIEEASKLTNGSSYMFSSSEKPLQPMAMLLIARKLCKGITVHGFRSTFRDWVAEETDHSPEVAEMALAHTIGNKVEAAYRRGKLLERRRVLMDDWQNYCLNAVIETNA